MDSSAMTGSHHHPRGFVHGGQLWPVEVRRPEHRKPIARGQVRLQNVEAGA